MEVLDHNQISHKISRLAYEILESNIDEDAILLAGINNNGYKFAEIVCSKLQQISNKKIIIYRIRLNPADPLGSKITINDYDHFEKHPNVIIVDDVANTGRTIFYACKVFMDILMRKVEVAVLVDRKHKLFPIKVDYVGLSLATTVQEKIDAKIDDQNNMSVILV